MSMVLKRRVGRLALEALLLLLSLVVLVPLLIMFFGSLKNPTEVTAFNLTPPEKWLWQNYSEVVNQGGLGMAFFNSMFITVTSTAITILLSSLASYVLARRDSTLCRFLYYFFFVGTLIPMQTIPTIQMFSKLGLYGGYTNAILLYCAINVSLSCFLYTGFIKGISRRLDEAAFIEGASVGKTFFLVIFPLLKPINVTVIVLIFTAVWNDINIPLYFLTDPDKWTMPLSVYQFFGRFSSSNWNLVFADLMLTALPVIIVYLFAQKYIISGLTEGAVKG